MNTSTAAASATPYFSLSIKTVDCLACGKALEPCSIEWCRCVARQVSPSCGGCGVCLCKVPDRVRLKFWVDAPEWLRASQALEIRRRTASRPVAALEAIDVLIVDDDEELRMLAAYSVQQMGYRVALAAGGHNALTVLEAYKPRVMITDALMPKMDGRELCQSVKIAHPDVKVIIMTSLYTAAHYKYEAYKKFQADEYLTKPIDFGLLQDLLTRFAPVESGRRA